jgi:DNA repair exonuclease SbcCD ATPase subunit
MRVTETKEITKVVREEVTVKRICDNCGNEITLWDRPEEYNYFLVTTHPYDWGNDSIDSYESYDVCCPKCALEMAEKYLANAYKEGYNTKTIKIEHVRSLERGTDRNYEHDIGGGLTMIYNESVAHDEWSDEKKLRKDFANTLKEMDRLENEYKKLKKKAHEIEDQLDIQPDEQKLRNDYTQTLKEMARLESEYKKLTKKGYDIENQLTSI